MFAKLLISCDKEFFYDWLQVCFLLDALCSRALAVAAVLGQPLKYHDTDDSSAMLDQNDDDEVPSEQCPSEQCNAPCNGSDRWYS